MNAAMLWIKSRSLRLVRGANYGGPTQSVVRSSRGVALFIVLALLVLCSIVVLAVISQATHTRMMAASSGSGIKADIIARAALDEIVHSLRREMLAGSHLENEEGALLMLPASAATVQPSRSAPQEILSGGSRFSNLLKQSSWGVPTYSSLSDPEAHPNQQNYPESFPASTLSTAEPSSDGRFLSPRRWNSPRLLPDGGFAEGDPLPYWVYLTREGPMQAATDGEVSTLADRSPANASYVIGRYAYQVYDISGLLDANLAGHPEELSPAQIQELKGTLAGSVLQVIPGINSAGSFLNWRNHGNSTEEYLTNQLTNTNGFLRPAEGERRFFNRQDLLLFAGTNHGVSQEALPFLTVFNRKLNAPVFSYPETGAVQANPVNLSPLRTRMESPGVSPLDGFSWREGDPVMPRKFPLERLDWLRFNGPRPDVTAEQIQSAFGLVWDGRVPDDSNPSDLRGDRWVYVGSTGSPDPDQPAAEILTLDQVAAEGREPNFFEILKAAIHLGSLGQAVAGTLAPDSDVFHGEPDLHILRIGANMIDQYDADSYPTLINFRLVDGAINPIIEVHGVESLPYISRIAPFYINPDWPNDPGPSARRMRGFLAPELWNPHQPGGINGPRPGDVRLFYTGGHALRTGHSNVSLDRFNQLGFAGGTMSLAENHFDSFYEPRPLTESISTRTGYFNTGMPFKDYPIGSGDPVVGGELLDLAGNMIAQPPPNAEDPIWWNGYYASNDSSRTLWIRDWFGGRFGEAPFNAILQFRNYRGHYQNYNVLAEGFYTNDPDINEGIGIQAGQNGSPASGFRKEEFPTPYVESGPAGTWETANAGALSNASQQGIGLPTSPPNSWEDLLTIRRQGSAQIFKPDPRTARLGVARYNFNLRNATSTSPNFGAFNWNPQHSFAASLRPANSGDMARGPVANYPFSGASPSDNMTLTGPNSNQYRPAMFERNLSADGAGSYYRDNDGITRPADNHFQAWANSVYNATASRPVILNRPFRSVAELGFVFRDLPHRSLDLFSQDSADAALLDFFSLREAPETTAGVINLTAAPLPVLQALLQGAARTPDAGVTIQPSEAETLSSHLQSSLSPSPPIYLADLVPLTATNIVSSPEGGPYPGIKTRREAVIRALASIQNERTWNLFIDVIAQVGNFPPGATQLNGFVIEGERRYWLHVAIDRYTGEVVDELREVVLE